MVTMLAARYEQSGPVEQVLSVREVPRPEPGPGQVRVRVAVSAINPTDVKIRGGLTPRPVIGGFQVPHMDGAGTIDAVGAGVDAARVGERVWLMLASLGNQWGTAAQWCVVPANRAVPLGPDASFDLGASLGVPAMTAAHCLFSDGSIAGADVLVAGGAGAVGRAAVQLGRWAGARVCATVSGPQKAEIARAAGADAVVNYRDPDAIARLQAWSHRVDRIVELALAPNLELDLAVSGTDTTVVVYATDGGDPVLPVRRLMTANVRLQFVLLYGVPQSQLDQMGRVVSRAVQAGALTAPAATRFALDDIVAAQQAQEAGLPVRVFVDIP